MGEGEISHSVWLDASEISMCIKGKKVWVYVIITVCFTKTRSSTMDNKGNLIYYVRLVDGISVTSYLPPSVIVLYPKTGSWWRLKPRVKREDI